MPEILPLYEEQLSKLLLFLALQRHRWKVCTYAQQGKYHYLHIPSRADGAILPKIDCIDIREHRKRGTMQGSFSEELLQSIIHRVIKKEGTILFHNRRGFARFQECLDCGHIPMCKHCSVSLTLHKNSGMVRCHYCGYAEKSLNSCTVCGGTDIKEAGTGTQKVEEELQELLLITRDTCAYCQNGLRLNL